MGNNAVTGVFLAAVVLHLIAFLSVFLSRVFVFDVTVEIAVNIAAVITLSAAKWFNPGMSQVMFFQI